ncbi:L-lactate permease [Haloglycomyces albus]|uniref:L-lactate permease n=1 Tax=Haloglycomyces albus TaxID=526067 RepID=UPI00046CC681|nr:L-lactate permease [Haloglycomyces albus]
MTTLAAVSPLLIVLLLTAVLRRPAHLASLLGMAFTALLIVAVPTFATGLDGWGNAVAGAGIITLSAAVVIVPGLYLNQQLAQRHVDQQLIDWTQGLPMSPPHKSALVVVAVAPALESLTGFGVSLLVTVPLLLAMTDRSTAVKQSLLGMNIMPWGTLGLATIIGSSLAGRPTTELSLATAVVSAGVFPLFGALTAVMVAAKGKRIGALASGALLGAVFSASLLGINAFGVVELAGVGAGVSTTLIGLVLFSGRRRLQLPPWSAVRPYAIMFGLVAFLRILPSLGIPHDTLTIDSGDVSFNLLASPGLALLITVLILARGTPDRTLARQAGKRAWKPITALAGFTFMAQLMVYSSMVKTIGEAQPVTTVTGFLFVSVLLGMASGYLTGSGVGGNALMMPLQSSVGGELGQPLLFAAVQNSAAGHTVFASMPIVLLTLAIAGDGKKGEDTMLIRYSLAVTVGVYLALTGGAFALWTVG